MDQDFSVVHNEGWCLIAPQSPMFANNLVVATVQQAANGLFTVTGVFGAESIRSLKSLLSNDYVNADGSYVDWFSSWRSAGQLATAMKVALVSCGQVLQPFLIQDVVGSGPVPASTILARDLSAGEATQIAGWLNAPQVK
jgi:hypothetical protein